MNENLEFLIFSSGGFFGTGYNAHVWLSGENPRIEYHNTTTGMPLDPETFRDDSYIKSLINHSKIYPLSENEIMIFRDAINKLEIMKWKHKYVHPSILDGNQWSLKYKYEDSSLVSIYGSNAYPRNWKNFINLVFSKSDKEHSMIRSREHA